MTGTETETEYETGNSDLQLSLGMSVSYKDKHTYTNKNTQGIHPLRQLDVDILYNPLNIVYTLIQSTGASCHSVYCQSRDLLDWMTAGGQDMTYTYTPTETTGSTELLCTVQLLSLSLSQSCTHLLLPPSAQPLSIFSLFPGCHRLSLFFSQPCSGYSVNFKSCCMHEWTMTKHICAERNAIIVLLTYLPSK